MARVYHFDLVVRDIDRASEFYSRAFDWKIEEWEGPMEYWLVTTGDPSQPGIDGGISVGEPNMSSGQLTLQVADLEDTVAKVVAGGGKVTREKGAVPGVGWLAEITDTEGNSFGLMQEDDTAR